MAFRMRARRVAAALVGLVLAGCAQPPQPTFHAAGHPGALSDWGVLYVAGGELRLADGVQPYALNSALFSDYAHKLRTVWLPNGAAAQYSETDAFELPVGAIISKTFYYPRVEGDASGIAVARSDDRGGDFQHGGLALDRVRLIETRLLVRRAEGWAAFAYRWNDAQDAATLVRAGDVLPLALVADDGARERFTYMVPDENQCAGCHATDNTTGALHPIGLKARHVNRDAAYPEGTENQLARFVRLGWLTGAPEPAQAPHAVDWRDAAAHTLDARARAYLDVNCGHCHSPKGPADTSGLWLDAATREPRRLGLCKPPVAAGQGTGDHQFGIVPGQPDASILFYRLQSTDPAAMMPELGRATAHTEGVALIREWIAQWDGGACQEQTQTQQQTQRQGIQRGGAEDAEGRGEEQGI